MQSARGLDLVDIDDFGAVARAEMDGVAGLRAQRLHQWQGHAADVAGAEALLGDQVHLRPEAVGAGGFLNDDAAGLHGGQQTVNGRAGIAGGADQIDQADVATAVQAQFADGRKDLQRLVAGVVVVGVGLHGRAWHGMSIIQN